MSFLTLVVVLLWLFGSMSTRLFCTHWKQNVFGVFICATDKLIHSIMKSLLAENHPQLASTITSVNAIWGPIQTQLSTVQDGRFDITEMSNVISFRVTCEWWTSECFKDSKEDFSLMRFDLEYIQGLTLRAFHSHLRLKIDVCELENAFSRTCANDFFIFCHRKI